MQLLNKGRILKNLLFLYLAAHVVDPQASSAELFNSKMERLKKPSS